MTNKRVYEKGSNDSKQNTRVKGAVKNGFLQLLFFLFFDADRITAVGFMTYDI